MHDRNLTLDFRRREPIQIAMQERFTEIVEGATGRKVIACMSQIHHDPDIAMELFQLEPGTEPVPAAEHHDPRTRV